MEIKVEPLDSFIVFLKYLHLNRISLLRHHVSQQFGVTDFPVKLGFIQDKLNWFTKLSFFVASRCCSW